MTDRELQKLKRVELLQLLVEQSRELDALRRELEQVFSSSTSRIAHSTMERKLRAGRFLLSLPP